MLVKQVPLLAKSDIVAFPYLPSTVMRATTNYEMFKQLEGGKTKPQVIEATSIWIQGWADAEVHDDASPSFDSIRVEDDDSAWDQVIANDGKVGRMHKTTCRRSAEPGRK